MCIAETARLAHRRITTDDAPFILNLLNQPAFIQYIGDRNVRNLADASRYIEERFLESYKRFGFGMFAVELKDSKLPIGICGFVKREILPEADIGFAFLPQHGSKGYALESANAMLEYGKDVLCFEKILAITTKDNERSAKLLKKINFKYEGVVQMSKDDEVNLYSRLL